MIERFDDGTVLLCKLSDKSIPGEMAREKIRVVARHFFQNRQISFRRQYEAKGVNQQIDMIIRIHYDPCVVIGMFAVLGNGDQFEIDHSTIVRDDLGHKYTEITLRRLEDFYDLETE